MPWKPFRRIILWRDITSLALAAGAVSGRLYFEREGRDVILEFADLVPSATTVSSVTLPNLLPPGLRPPRNVELALAPRVHDAASEIKGAVRIRTDGTLDFYRPTAGAAARGQVRFRTSEPMPANIPGIEVL